MGEKKRNKVEYKIHIYTDRVELVRSDDYEVKKIEIKRNVDYHTIATVYVDGKIEVSIDMKYLPSELEWILKSEKLVEYERAFGTQTVIQKIVKELTKYIAEYLKL